MQISCDTINYDIFPFNCMESVSPHFITMLIGFRDFVIQLFDYQWITKMMYKEIIFAWFYEENVNDKGN